jgi:hypothetical protein
MKEFTAFVGLDGACCLCHGVWRVTVAEPGLELCQVHEPT